MKNKTNYFLTYLKGFLMGTCDVVPGISGGTIAFITGIYEQFIRSVKNIATKDTLVMLKHLLTLNIKEFQKQFTKLEYNFLATLLIGIFTALLIVSKLVLFLLETEPGYTLSFFIGLIIASTLFILKDIKTHSTSNQIISIIGFAIGISLITFNTSDISNPSLLYIAFGGFIGISAMFLPGISGSFILLILGLYNTVYGALHDISNQLNIIVAFAIGAGLGAIFISRLIDYLFQKDKSKTLYFLLGLVLGALSTPIKIITQSTQSITPLNITQYILFAMLGILIVYFTYTLSQVNTKLKIK